MLFLYGVWVMEQVGGVAVRADWATVGWWVYINVHLVSLVDTMMATSTASLRPFTMEVKDVFIPQSQYHACWADDDVWIQDFNSHGIDLVYKNSECFQLPVCDPGHGPNVVKNGPSKDQVGLEQNLACALHRICMVHIQNIVPFYTNAN